MANRSSKRFKDNGDKRGNKSFVPIRHDVLDSEAWANTRAWGTRLILDLAAQYRGNNNGDLCAAWSVMNQRGWRSRDTLDKAKLELLDKKWIVETRKGGRKIPTLYALTFWGIDECNGKLDPDIKPKNKPLDTWKAGNTAPDIIEEKRKERARKINISNTATVSMT